MKTLNLTELNITELDNTELETVNGGLFFELLALGTGLILFAGEIAEEVGRSLAAAEQKKK